MDGWQLSMQSGFVGGRGPRPRHLMRSPAGPVPGGVAKTRASVHKAIAVTLRRLVQHEALTNLKVRPSASLSPVLPTRWHPQAWG